jgi:hypothetical protein
MRAARMSVIQSLRRLTNIAWLEARQLNEVADALMVSRVAKRGIIFDEKVSSESALILLSGPPASPAAIARAIAYWS